MAANRLLGRTLLAAIAVAGATVTPAAVADPAPAERAAPKPLTILHLTTDGGPAKAGYRTATLTCDPAGGTHSSPHAACRRLASAEGRFESLGAGEKNAMCPLIYKPITVRASGTWKNRSVNFKQTYSNRCVLESYTGPVFTF